MKKLIIAAILAVSFQSAASVYEVSESTELSIAATSSKSQAYQQGNKALQEIKQLTGQQIYNRLHLLGDNINISSLKISEGHVYVHEFSAQDGSLKYRPQIKLTYSYSGIEGLK
jgi:hypothetical protein